MKTTKAILLLSFLALMPACITTKQQYAGVNTTQIKAVSAMFYVDRNNQLKPFYLPQ